MIKSIRKLSFSGLILACITGLCSTSAMEEIKRNPMNIGDITPVKDGMKKEEAREAILSFLKAEVFKPENEIKQQDITSDRSKKFGIRGDEQRLITLKDGTEWVGSRDGLQRFLGALYLKKAIQHHNLDKWHAVETKFMLKDGGNTITIHVKSSKIDPLKNIFTINSDNFISFSKYVGDHKPTNDDLRPIGLDFGSKHEITIGTGYADMQQNANLRIEKDDNKVTVIDTEYPSFKNDNKVQPPSQKTEQEIGGATFTFSKEELLVK